MTLREKAGLSQRKVSEMLDVRQGTVSDWERGKSVPHLPADKFFTMVRAYGASVYDVIQAFEDDDLTPAPALPPNVYGKLLEEGMTEEQIIRVFGSQNTR